MKSLISLVAQKFLMKEVYGKAAKKKVKGAVYSAYTSKDYQRLLKDLSPSNARELLVSFNNMIFYEPERSAASRKQAIKAALDIFEKDMKGVRLNSFEKEFLYQLQVYANKAKATTKPYVTLKVNSHRPWISHSTYWFQNKWCIVEMLTKTGYKDYAFFNVPYTKWLELVAVGGEYMWKYFGTHYSQNPQNWVKGGRIGAIRGTRKLEGVKYGTN